MLSMRKQSAPNSMPWRAKNVRVVAIDSNYNDVQVSMQIIQDAGIECAWKVVDSPDVLKKTLKRFDPHLVICEYDVQGINEQIVAKIVEQSDTVIPIVLVTGKLNEDEAEELTHKWAYDYVLKDHLKRLPLIVLHALERRELIEQNRRLRQHSGKKDKLGGWEPSPKGHLTDQLTRLESEVLQREQINRQLSHREKKYRQLLEDIASIVIRWSTDGRISYMNSFGLEYFGYTEQDVIGYHVRMLFPMAEKNRQFPDLLLESPSQFTNVETENVRANGSRVWIAWSNRLLLSSNGKPEGVLSVGNDITRLKKTEKTLEHKQTLLDTFFGKSPVGMIVLGVDKKIHHINSTAADYLGKRPSEVEGRSLTDYLSTDITEFYDSIDNVVRAGKSLNGVEYRGELAGRKGRRLHLISSFFPMYFPDGSRLVGVISLNITRTCNGQNAFQRSQALYREFVENSNSVILRWAPDGTILFANTFCGKQFGFSPSQMEGMSLVDLFPKSDEVVQDIQSMTRDMLANPENYINMHHRHVRRDGSVVWIAWTNRPVRDINGRVVEFLSIGNDITELVNAEAALKNSEQFFGNFVDSIDAVIVRLSMNGIVSFINRYGEMSVGRSYKKLLGLSYAGTIFPTENCDAAEKIDSVRHGKAQSVRFECRSVIRHKESRWMHWTAKRIESGEGAAAEILCTGVDISERRRIEEALHYRIRFERLISTLSTRFINLTSAKVDRGIETSLRLIGLFAGADRSYLFLFDESNTHMSNKFEWVNKGVRSQKGELQNLKISDFSWLMSSIQAGESVLISDTAKLPPEASNEAKTFDAGNIKSVICVPLISRSSIIGFAGFDAVLRRQKWTDNVLKLLQIVGSMFVNAVERKRFDEKLQQSEWIYRSIFENTGTATTIVERDTTISLANNEFGQMLGYTKDEIEGRMSWRQVAHPDEIKKLEAHHFERRHNPDAVPSRYESMLVTRQGKVLDIMIVAGMIRGTDRSVVTFVDITDRKRNERQLAKEREKAELRAREAQEGRRILEALMDYIPEAIIIADAPDVRIRMMSRYAARLLGIKDKESIVSNAERSDKWGFYHLDGATLPSSEELPLSRTIQKGEEVINEEWVIKRPDGRSVIILANSGPVYDSRGRISGGVVAWRDITQRKLAEEAVRDHSHQLEQVNKTLVKKNQELDEANAKLKELDSLKSEFVSMASHELRTPLTGIIGFTETLMAKDIQLTEQERDKYLSIIEAEGKRLGLLLGELLDISKIEKGVDELVTSMINVAGLARESVASMQIPPEVHIRIETDDERKLRAPIDHDRMKQVFMNIIDNAIIYSKQKVDIDIRISQEDEKMIRVVIADNGPGIPSDELGKIFEKFYRSRRNPPGENRGSGLGLSIAKGIIEAHGGKIWAESEPGNGTDIIFTLSKRKSEYASFNY